MELTNLIWHLGAALAALWAAFAYRRLRDSHEELKRAVLPTLLTQVELSSPDGGGGVSPRLRSLRVRALSWVTNEFSSRHGVELEILGQSALIALPYGCWFAAFAELLGVLTAQWQNSLQGVADRSKDDVGADVHRLISEAKSQGSKLKLEWLSVDTEQVEGRWQWV